MLIYSFATDVKEMTGETLSRYWEITLKFLAPAVILFVLISSIIMRIMKGITYPAYDSETVSELRKWDYLCRF